MIINANSVYIPLADQSVHCVVTSPPYWGLRAYELKPSPWPKVTYSPMAGMPPITVPGCDPDCDHVWGDEIPGESRGGSGTPTDKNNRGEGYARGESRGNWCQRCGGWRGCLGLEPTIEMYVGHLVAIFREVKRVLHPSGVFFLNLGDSFAGSMKGVGADGTAYAGAKQSTNRGSVGIYQERPPTAQDIGLKPKDLCMVPQRVALALQADGWWLRSEIPWPKRNAMPGSQQDRPTVSHEHIFMLTKSERYYYDQEAVKQPPADASVERISQRTFGQQTGGDKDYSHGVNPNMSARKTLENLAKNTDGGRIRRTTDWWFDGLRHAAIEAQKWSAHALDVLDNGGPLVNEDGEIIALDVTTKGYHGAHFATWPVDLVTPLILAGSSGYGVCPKCGAPWERVVEREDKGWDGSRYGERVVNASGGAISGGTAKSTLGSSHGRLTADYATVGWQPTCSCDAGDPVPAVVLDPFAGSGTTGEACRYLPHPRKFAGLDLSPTYLHDLAAVRAENRAPKVAAEGFALLEMLEEMTTLPAKAGSFSGHA